MSKDGGAAFPGEGPFVNEAGRREPQLGMTLRDWFAGQALVGILASHPMPEHPQYWDWLSGIAVTPYRIADAMLAEREKRDE